MKLLNYGARLRNGISAGQCIDLQQYAIARTSDATVQSETGTSLIIMRRFLFILAILISVLNVRGADNSQLSLITNECMPSQGAYCNSLSKLIISVDITSACAQDGFNIEYTGLYINSHPNDPFTIKKVDSGEIIAASNTTLRYSKNVRNTHTLTLELFSPDFKTQYNDTNTLELEDGVEYEVFIPGGFVSYAETTQKGTYFLKESTYRFWGGTNGGGEDPQPQEPWTSTPADNSTVDVLSRIDIAINEGLTDQVDGMQANIAYEHPDGKHENVEAYIQSTSKNTFSVLWNQGDIYKQGTYKFTISNLKDVTVSGGEFSVVTTHRTLDPMEITINVDGSKEGDYGNIDIVPTVRTIGQNYVDLQLGEYNKLGFVEGASATIYKEDNTVLAENLPLTTYSYDKYLRIEQCTFPNETANYTIVIPANMVTYNNSRYFNEIRCPISITKKEEAIYTFTPSADATDIAFLKEIKVKIDGITEHVIGQAANPSVFVKVQYGYNQEQATSFVKNDDDTYTIGLKGYEGPADLKITFSSGAWIFNGESSPSFSITYNLVEDKTEYPALDMTVTPEAYADGKPMAVIEKSAWCDANSDSDLKPGDKGVWFVNYTDEKVAEVRYWFETSWTTDWLIDNNGITEVQGKQPYRKAVKTENGWMQHFWAFYQEVIPEDQTLTVHMLALDADGKKIGKNTLTWTNKDIFTPTLTYDMLTIDPAAGSELESATTLINVKAEQDLSKLVAYTAPVYDKLHLDDNNMPTLLVDRIDYGVAKVNEKEWCIILKLSDEYLAATNGEVYLAIEAYDKEGYPAIDALYTMLDYKYAAAAKVAEVSVTPINGTVAENLDVFTFANVDANTTGSLGRNYSNTEKASLAGGDYIYTFADSDWNSEAMTLTVPADKQPTEAGVYTLNIPQGYFLVGDDNPAQSKPIVANYGKQLIVEVHDTTYIDVPAAVVAVTYNVSSKVGEAETVVSGNTSLIEKGKAFTADINVLDENWTAEVTGATLADNVITTAELTEDATVEVVYVYNGKIVVIDDETTSAEGVDVDGLKVESVGGKIIVSGLNSGEMAMLYGMNAALLANGTAVYNTVEFEAPAGVAYIVSVVHNGNKLGFKILNK